MWNGKLEICAFPCNAAECVAVITPFKRDGSVDYVSLGNIINYLIESKVDFLVALGTTGETSTLTKNERKKMSIIEKYGIAIEQKDEATMNELLHDDFKFTMHSNGAELTKQDVIGWAMSDDINRERVRIIYENDEIGIEHAFVTFSDGNQQAVMGVYTFKDGQVIGFETGATNIPKE